MYSIYVVYVLLLVRIEVHIVPAIATSHACRKTAKNEVLATLKREEAKKCKYNDTTTFLTMTHATLKLKGAKE
jgi:hypothetical protein